MVIQNPVIVDYLENKPATGFKMPPNAFQKRFHSGKFNMGDRVSHTGDKSKLFFDKKRIEFGHACFKQFCFLFFLRKKPFCRKGQECGIQIKSVYLSKL